MYKDEACILQWDDTEYKAQKISPTSWYYRYHLQTQPVHGKRSSQKKVNMNIIVGFFSVFVQYPAQHMARGSTKAAFAIPSILLLQTDSDTVNNVASGLMKSA